MPKIPVAQKSLIQHSDNAVTIGGAPGMGWNVDHSLERLGAVIAEGSASVGRNMMDYEALKARAIDEDNLSAATLKIKQYDADLQLKMQQNPQAYADFQKWSDETAAAVDGDLAAERANLSPYGRRQLEQMVAGAKLGRDTMTKSIGTQATISNIRANYDTRIDALSLEGNLTDAEEQIQLAADTGIFAPFELDKYRNRVAQLSDFGAAKRAIDAGDPAIMEQLQAQKDGNFVNYKNLNLADRDNLLNLAGSVQSQKMRGVIDQYDASILAGSIPDESEIDQLFEQKKIDLDTKNNLVKMCRNAVQSRQKAGDAAALEQQKAFKDQLNYDYEALRLEIFETPFSADSATRQKQKNDYYNRIVSGFKTADPAKAKTLLTDLNDAVEKVERPDTSYLNGQNFKNGESYIKILESQGKFFAYKDRPFWWDGTDKSKEAKNAVKESLTINLKDYLRANPKATDAEVQAFIDGNVKTYNATTLDGMAQKAFGISAAGAAASKVNAPEPVKSALSGQSTTTANEVRRIVGDKIGIYDAKTQTFIRWE